jgi:uncharacterized protein YjeT (DUF2065 family)
VWTDFLAAMALVLVIEGILPFLSPGRYRETMQTVTRFSDRNLRILGLGSMVLGLVLLFIVRS